MNFSKLLAAVLALGVSAEMSTFVGLGATVGYSAPKFKTGKKVVDPNAKGTYLGGSDFKEDGSGDDFGLKNTDDIKGYVPAGAFLTAIVTFDKLVGVLSLGLGLDAGYRYNFATPKDNYYGETVGSPNAAGNLGTSIAIKAPTGSFFMVPKVLIGMDIADIHILLSLGMDISYATYHVLLGKSSTTGNADVDKDGSAWLFGLRVGLEAIFQVAPCAGVGVGIHFTYWPEAMNGVKDEELMKSLNSSLTKSDVSFHVGGSWSISGSVTGHFAFG